MKKIIAVILVLFMLSAMCVMADGIGWYHTFDEGLAAAKKTGKPIMTDVFTESCGWCEKLDMETFSNTDVIALSKKFTCVKLDADKYPAIPDKYNVRGYPTILFFDSKGERIHTVIGYKNAENFLSEMKTALNKTGADDSAPAVPSAVQKINLPILISFSSGKITAQGAKVSVSGCDFSNAYDNSYHLRMLEPGKSCIKINFNLSQAPPAAACLYIKHLTSMAGEKNGWAPITISVNGKNLAQNWDTKSGKYITTKFNIAKLLAKGNNNITFTLDSDAKTHYWLKEIAVK